MDRSLRQSQASAAWAHLQLMNNWWGFQARDTLQGSTDNCSIDKAGTSLEWQEHFSQFQATTDVLPCHIHLPLCLWIMDLHSRAAKKRASHGNQVLCESWTFTVELQRRRQDMEIRCYCKILYISYKDHFTKEEVHAKIWYRNVFRSSKPSCEAMWRGEEDRADRIKWVDSIREWTGPEFTKSQRAVENREK